MSPADLRPRRRDLLLAGGALLLPGVAAAARQARELVVLVLLRGGLDGLAAVPPVGDRNYRRRRGGLALPEDATLPLAEGFALHPALAFLHERWAARELAVLHAASTPYRDRSHFDAQDVLESGADRAFGDATGWLSRALAARGDGAAGVAVGATVPLALRGPGAATSWAPSQARPPDEDTLARLADLYASDAAFSADLAAALRTAAWLDGAGRGRDRSWKALTEATARLLLAADGPVAAVVSLDGWDTHASQGTVDGALAGRLEGLDAGLRALREALGEAWSRTSVVIASEFGRTVAMNGTGGTDHGTGTAAFLLGGRVRGGRMLGDWPGLARLHQDRDLAPANDVRALFAGIAREAWGAERGVFDGVKPLGGLLA